MNYTKKYTDEDFVNAIKSSFSIRQVLKKLGVKPWGGNYWVAHRKIKLLNLDISHFTGQGYLKNKTHSWAKKIPLSEILVENSKYTSSSKLRKRLLKENYFEPKCYKCGNTHWLNQPISLEVEHINGNNVDNRLENLTILCPNCHAQTPTYRGRNKNKGVRIPREKKIRENKPKIERIKKPKKEYFCKKCNKRICNHTKHGLCGPCVYERYFKFDPSKEELEKLVQEKPFTEISKIFNVSDVAVKKRCKKLGINIPNRRGYWG